MKRLEETIKKLMPNGGILPGKVREMYTSCGNANCKCMDAKNPQKHSYNQLSYSSKGKTKTLYIKKNDVSMVKKMTNNYQDLRSASLELGDIVAGLSKEKGIKKAMQIVDKSFKKVSKTPTEQKKLGTELIKDKASIKKLKEKISNQANEIKKNNRKIKNIEKSRYNWKEKHHEEKAKREKITKERITLGKAHKKLEEKNEQLKTMLKKTQLKKIR